MTDVNAFEQRPPDHIAYLLHSATRRARAEAEAEAEARAFLGVPLRASESRLLDLVPADGGRVTDLAAHLGVSKQALGQLVARLSDLGYVTTSADPTDRRARVVRRTPTGDRYRQAARDLLATVEARWQTEVGEQSYETFRAVLHEIARGAPSS